MDRLAESLQCGSKTFLFYDLVIVSKETRNITSFRAIETLKKSGGIAEKWSNLKPVSPSSKMMNWFGIRSNI